ncbi:hypothetical protein [Variovorax sp. Root434]|uniref:hypothetical protein n=1 Tax=Variovorax sp. Root434 TaxID=1736536 RepID=UPI0006F67037|nr:hypothetical protein [Variovorax sp. Root434]KQX34443.1 hypothetical protein ASD05_24520 [Variovorax sp. Root434]
MFVRENSYRLARHRSPKKSRAHINLEGQKHWPTHRSGARGIEMPSRAAYAQNDAYLELCNPGWDLQWRAGMGNLYVVLPAAVLIWMWCGLAVHPLLFGQIIFFFMISDRVSSTDLWLGWLLLLPLALASAFMIFAWFHYMGMRTCFFTDARGRIRFNRLTRKVYVLRPGYCGGNVVLDWERLVALFEPEGASAGAKQTIKALALYHPPFDSADPSAKGEDCIFVGPGLSGTQNAAYLWEYIRQYMEVGPTVDHIPADASSTYKGIARYLHPDYTTYCGKPDARQYRLEQKPGFMETSFHMMSQVTCSWPAFPKEWQSDSGIGEPEDKPVQTGAVMTALVYRSQGKLSKADEIEFLRHWGTAEALQEAMSRES